MRLLIATCVSFLLCGAADADWTYDRKKDFITDKVTHIAEATWEDGHMRATCNYDAAVGATVDVLGVHLSSFSGTNGQRENLTYRVDGGIPTILEGIFGPQNSVVLYGADARKAISAFSEAEDSIVVQIGSHIPSHFDAHESQRSLRLLLEQCALPPIEIKRRDFSLVELNSNATDKQRFGLLITATMNSLLPCENVVSVHEVTSPNWPGEFLRRVDCGPDGVYRVGKIPDDPTSRVLDRWDLEPAREINIRKGRRVSNTETSISATSLTFQKVLFSRGELADTASAVRSAGHDCTLVIEVERLLQNDEEQPIFRISCSNGSAYQATIVDGKVRVKEWTGAIFGQSD